MADSESPAEVETPVAAEGAAVAVEMETPAELEAHFQPGYRGLKQMAMDTNKYRYINSGPVYEGETVIEDRISGLHHIEGHKLSNKVEGWIAAFELYSGYAKTFYMTVDEIHEHAKKYNPGGYESIKGGWKRYKKADKEYQKLKEKSKMYRDYIEKVDYIKHNLLRFIRQIKIFLKS